LEFRLFWFIIENMVITYHGDRCFKIQSGKLGVVSDPLPRFKGDITLHTQKTETRDFPAESGHFFGPGEYESREVEITGFPNKDGSANYAAVVEEIRLVFMGSPLSDLEPGQLEKFGETDILFAPAGVSAKVIKQLQPKIVIPFYKKPDDLKKFLKEVDKKEEVMDKLTLKKKDIETGTKIVVLKP